METTYSYPSANTQYMSFNQTGSNLFAPGSYGSSSSGTMFDSANGSVNNMHNDLTSKPSFASIARGFKQENTNHNCGFQTRVVDNCSKSRLYALAMEYYLLEEAPPTPDGVRCLMSDCPRAFRDPKQMLWHLRECDRFSNGKYDCPECNVTQTFRTTTQRKCSWLRSRLSTKAMQILHASAAVVKQMIGPKSHLCAHCRHTLKQDLGRELRNRGGSMDEFDEVPLYSSRKRFNSYPDHGKRPSTDSSSSSGYSSQEFYELGGTSTVPELPGHQVGSELEANDTFNIQWGPNHTAQSVTNLCVIQETNHQKPATDVSCLSARSMGGFSTDVSPTSSPKSPNTINGTMTMQSGDMSSLFQMSRQPSTANINQPSSNMAGIVYNQSTHVSSSIGMPDLSASMFPQDPLEGNNPNITKRNSVRTRQHTPDLSVNIPPTGVHFDNMTCGPDNADYAFLNQFFNSGNTATTTTTPTEETFRNSLARSYTTTSTRTGAPFTATITPSSNHIHRQETGSGSVSPDSINSSDSSPGSGGKQGSATDFRCPECDFIPKGKLEKAPTYLYKHRQTHLKELRFSCQQCGKTYSRKDNVTAHAKKTHGGFGLGTPSPAPWGKKRQGSGNRDQLSVHRKKSRSYSNESAALQVSGQFGATF
ncbi:hypothetical protein PG988_012302 [Apiospora saccharicola]